MSGTNKQPRTNKTITYELTNIRDIFLLIFGMYFFLLGYGIFLMWVYVQIKKLIP